MVQRADGVSGRPKRAKHSGSMARVRARNTFEPYHFAAVQLQPRLAPQDGQA